MVSIKSKTLFDNSSLLVSFTNTEISIYWVTLPIKTWYVLFNHGSNGVMRRNYDNDPQWSSTRM